jgi:hypothetical protein
LNSAIYLATVDSSLFNLFAVVTKDRYSNVYKTRPITNTKNFFFSEFTANTIAITVTIGAKLNANVLSPIDAIDAIIAAIATVPMYFFSKNSFPYRELFICHIIILSNII